jgi:CrcB protein
VPEPPPPPSEPSLDDPAGEPIDPDVDLHQLPQRGELRQAPFDVLGVIAAGGAIGALARYGLAEAWPHRTGAFPWATLVTNVSGCLLIGVLMVLLTDLWPARPLLRPFFGTGMLGGYTTFSTYTVDAQHLATVGAAPTALLYLAGTLLAALAAVATGIALTRAVTGTGRTRHRHRTAR